MEKASFEPPEGATAFYKVKRQSLGSGTNNVAELSQAAERARVPSSWRRQSGSALQPETREQQRKRKWLTEQLK